MCDITWKEIRTVNGYSNSDYYEKTQHVRFGISLILLVATQSISTFGLDKSVRKYSLSAAMQLHACSGLAGKVRHRPVNYV